MRVVGVLLSVLMLMGCSGATATTLLPESTPLTIQAWIVFADNGIREMRTRFESFASGRTPEAEVKADIAYFEREIARVDAIEPDACWVEMHAAYRAVMSNAKALLEAAYAGDMTTAQERYADTGTLNNNFTRAQEEVAGDCV